MVITLPLLHICIMLKALTFVATFCISLVCVSQDYQAKYRVVCNLPEEVSESSGLVRNSDGTFWTHGDGKNPSELYQFDTTGRLLRTLGFSNIQNVDWEDISSDEEGNIWIGDIGNNDSDREDLMLHKIDNPSNHDSEVVFATTLKIQYPDQIEIPSPIGNRNFDVEGIAFYKDSILLITKNRSYPNSGFAKIYIVPANSGQAEARLVDSVFTETHIQLGRITGADYSAKENLLVINSLRRIYTIPQKNGVFYTDSMKTYRMDFHSNQFESLVYVGNHTAYVTAEKPSVFCEIKWSDDLFVYPAKFNSFDKECTPYFSKGAVYFPKGFTGMIALLNTNGQRVREYSLSNAVKVDLGIASRGVYIIECRSAGDERVRLKVAF